MRIYPISSFNTISKSYIQNKNQSNNHKKLDTVKTPYSSIYSINFKENYKYQKIKEAQELIEKNKSNLCNIEPKTCAKFALTIKDALDKKYQNYRIVSIGTSPDAITRTMEKLGCNVIYIPISGLHWFPSDLNLTEDKEYIEQEYKNFPIVMDYLRYKGLNSKDNKKNIIIDYCSTGISLDTIAHYINANIVHNKDNVIPYDFLFELSCNQSEIEEEKKYSYSNDELNLYGLALYGGIVEKISKTPHFYIDEERNKDKEGAISSEGKTNEEIFKEFENYSNPLANAFQLLAEKELKKLKK